MPFVLDASVALSWSLNEGSSYADGIMERLGKDVAIVPVLWPIEIANSLLVAERRGRLTQGEVARAIDLYLHSATSVQDVSAEMAFGPVFDLARQQRLTSYDATYLYLAMREGLPLATLDGALKAAAARVGVALVE